jgi:hypothetical protein
MALHAEPILRAIATWQCRLGLLHWAIRLDPDTPADAGDGVRANAEIVCHDQYDRAELRLAADWRTWDPTDIGNLHLSLDYLICHELLHALMRDLDRLVFDDLEGLVHRDALSVLTEGYHRKREHLVDRLARTLTEDWGAA